jgi:hypothetical protein
MDAGDAKASLSHLAKMFRNELIDRVFSMDYLMLTSLFIHVSFSIKPIELSSTSACLLPPPVAWYVAIEVLRPILDILNYAAQEG